MTISFNGVNILHLTNTFKRLVTRFFLCLLVSACAVQAASADSLADIEKAGKIRIAVAVGTPLYSYYDSKMQLVGSDVETAQLLAKDLGVKAEIVSVPNSARIPTLLANKVDIVVSDLSISKEREKVIDFSRPYATISILVGAPASVNIRSYSDLAGKKVGVTRATVNDKLTTDMANNAKILRFEDDATLITAILTGQVEVWSSTAGTLSELNKRAPNLKMEQKFLQKEFEVGIGIGKGQPALKEWIDSWVATNLKNGKLNGIYRKYHGRDLPFILF